MQAAISGPQEYGDGKKITERPPHKRTQHEDRSTDKENPLSKLCSASEAFSLMPNGIQPVLLAPDEMFYRPVEHESEHETLKHFAWAPGHRFPPQGGRVVDWRRSLVRIHLTDEVLQPWEQRHWDSADPTSRAGGARLAGSVAERRAQHLCSSLR
jgi:hypothetical protein